MIVFSKWRVKELISKAGMTEGQAAQAIGINKGTLSGAINGHREPDLSELVALVRVLRSAGVDVPAMEDLIEGDPSPGRPKDGAGRVGAHLTAARGRELMTA